MHAKILSKLICEFCYCKYESIRAYSSDLKSRLDNKDQSLLFENMF
jgi:hypothetical protein